MPPLRLTTLLQSAVPQVSGPSRALLSSLACINGSLLPANEIAAWVGLRNRYQLSRVLRRDGLRPISELAGCVRVLYWRCRAEETGASLLELARHDHVDPAVAYRLVQRITGKRWSELRRADLDVILSRLRSNLRPVRPHVAAAPPTSILPRRTSNRVPVPAPDHPKGRLAARVTLPDRGLDDVVVTAERVALVARPRAAAVEVLELPSLKSLGTVSTGPNPTRIAVTRSGERAFVTAQFGEEVNVLDLRTGRQLRSISFAGYGHPLGMALARDEHMLYVATNLDRLYRVEIGRPDRLMWSAIPNASQHLAIHPDGHRIVANGWHQGILTECDTSTLRVTRAFRLGGCVQQTAFSASGDRMFVANMAGWLDVVRFSTGAREVRIDLGGGAFGVTLSRDARVLAVSLLTAGCVVLVDAVTWRILARIETGGRPRTIAVDSHGAGLLVANENGWVDLLT